MGQSCHWSPNLQAMFLWPSWPLKGQKPSKPNGINYHELSQLVLNSCAILARAPRQLHGHVSKSACASLREQVLLRFRMLFACAMQARSRFWTWCSIGFEVRTRWFWDVLRCFELARSLREHKFAWSLCNFVRSLCACARVVPLWINSTIYKTGLRYSAEPGSNDKLPGFDWVQVCFISWLD